MKKLELQQERPHNPTKSFIDIIPFYILFCKQGIMSPQSLDIKFVKIIYKQQTQQN